MTRDSAGGARTAGDSEHVDRLAAAGLVTYGVVHLVLGSLAVRLALGDRSGGTSTTGAVKEIAQQPFGGVLVWLVALGMALLVVWRGLEAVTGHQDEEGFTRTRKRATSGGKAVVYATIAYSAVKVATGSDSGSKTDTMTARLMDAPGGQVLVGAVGAGIVGVGIGLLVAAGRESYLKRLDAEGRTGKDGTAYRWLGRVGHVAKGLALGGVGVLFLVAAVRHEPKKSGGLDQALRALLGESYGPALTLALGIGFAAYGVFCFAQARHLDR